TLDDRDVGTIDGVGLSVEDAVEDPEVTAVAQAADEVELVLTADGAQDIDPLVAEEDLPVPLDEHLVVKGPGREPLAFLDEKQEALVDPAEQFDVHRVAHRNVGRDRDHLS